MNPQEEILSLTRELSEAGHRYYVLDDPTMPDFEYDQKLRHLEELEAAGIQEGDTVRMYGLEFDYYK